MPLYVFTDEPCEVGDVTQSGHRVLAVLELVPTFSGGGAKKRCLMLGPPPLRMPTLTFTVNDARRSPEMVATTSFYVPARRTPTPV